MNIDVLFTPMKVGVLRVDVLIHPSTEKIKIKNIEFNRQKLHADSKSIIFIILVFALYLYVYTFRIFYIIIYPLYANNNIPNLYEYARRTHAPRIFACTIFRATKFCIT